MPSLTISLSLKSRLRSSTRGNSDSYGLLGFNPSLVFDFVGNYFRKGSEDSTLASATTYTGASNGTMTDSDGLLKWKPHNLQPYSEDLSGSGPYGRAGLTLLTNQVTAPDGELTADLLTEDAGTGAHRVQVSGVVNSGVNKFVTAFFAKANGRDFVNLIFPSVTLSTAYAYFDISTGVVGSSNAVDATTIEDVGGGWFLCKVFYTLTTTSAVTNYPAIRFSDTDASTRTNNYTGDGVSGVYLWGIHQFKNSLGGMVDNPAQPAGLETYVPTTSAAVYLPRTGNHVYNGTAWVNEGLLLESEARTNLFTYSNDFTASSWQKGVTVTPNDAVSPDGTSNASRFPFGSSGYFQASLSRTVGQTYTVSAWVKSYDGTDEAFQLYGENGGFSQNFVATSEWQRFSFTYTATSSAGGYGDGIGRPTTNIPADLHVYGMQLEAGSTPSSYIPTTSATVTRAAETLTVAAANMPWPTVVETTGTELVTNGTFDTDLTGWTSLSNATWVSGAINCAGGGFKQVGVFTGAKTVRLSFDQTVNSGTRSRVRIRNAGGSGDVAQNNYYYGTGPQSYEFSTTDGLSIWFSVEAGNDINFDNISVKEINPLSVSIQMDGRMTYADTGGFHYQYLWQLDGANRVRAYVNTFGTYVGRQTIAQEVGNVEAQTTTDGDYYTPGINVPFNIASRHGSTFINGAVDGTALTAKTTPTALPDLSATDFKIGSNFMGNIGKLRVWADDLGDTGIAEATLPSTEPSLSLTFDGSETSFTVLDWSE